MGIWKRPPPVLWGQGQGRGQIGHRLRPKALGKGKAHLFYLVVEPAMTTAAPRGAQHRAGTWGKAGIYKRLICHGVFKLNPLHVFLCLSSFYSQIPVNRAEWIGSATQQKKKRENGGSERQGNRPRVPRQMKSWARTSHLGLTL